MKCRYNKSEEEAKKAKKADWEAKKAKKADCSI